MEFGALKILLIQDIKGDTNLIPDLIRELREVRLEIHHNIQVSSSLEMLKQIDYNAILLDLGQSSKFSIETVKTIVKASGLIPVLVLTSTDDDELGIDAIKAGAQDYLIKDQFTTRGLIRSIKYSMERVKNRPLIVENSDCFEPTFDMAPIGIAHLSTEMEFLRVNKKLCDIIGKNSEEILNTNLKTFIIQNDSGTEYLKVFSGELSCFSFENKISQSNGESLWCNITLSRVSANSGDDYIIALVEDISVRKATEEKLLLSESFLSEAQELAHLGNYHLQLPDGRMHWSEETYRIIGWPQSEHEPTLKEMMEMVHPDDKTNFMDSVKTALKNQKRFDVEFRIICSDSNEKYIHCIGEPRINDDGGFSEVYGTMMDITQWKEAEAELKYSHELLSGMFASLKEAVFLVSTNNLKIKDHNKAAEIIFGYSSKELKGQSLQIVLKDECSLQEIDRNLKDINGTGFFETELTLKRKDNSLFSAEVYIRSIQEDGQFPMLYVSVIRDITERKLFETALRESEQRISTIFREVPSAVLISSFNNGKYIDVNLAFENITGFNREEVVGSNLKDLNFFPDINSRNEIIRKIRDEGAVRNLEINFSTKENELKTGLVSSVLMDVIDDQYLLTVITDITERKKANEQVRKYVNELQVNKESLEKSTKELAELNASLKELNSSKDKLFSIVAHDLKSPFAALLGFSEFLTNNINDLSPDEIREFTNRIYHSLINVFRLIENLLQWSRLHSGRIEFHPDYFSFKVLSKEVIEVHKVNASNKNIKIINNIEDEAFVYADRDMIETIMRNLLSNAIKFTPPEGMVILNAYDRVDAYVIEVSDTGIGIPAEHLPKLFVVGESFKKEGTDHEKGTGLGLILCKEFVEKNGGKIWVDSKLGAGSKFSFSVPKK